MPCRGCGKRVSQVEGLFKMRFMGRPEGRLMKGAPGNYVQGQIYKMPFRHSKFKFWELIEKEPELVIPAATSEDSVYEEKPFEEPIYVEDIELKGVEPSEEATEPEIDEPKEPESPEEIVDFKDTMPPGLRASLYSSESAILDVDMTSTKDDDVTISEPELEEDMDVSLEVLEKSTMAQLRVFIKSQGADPNPKGKKGYISRAELLDAARSLLPDEA